MPHTFESNLMISFKFVRFDQWGFDFFPVPSFIYYLRYPYRKKVYPV